MINKKTLLFNRNDKGELIPVEVELNLPDKPKVKIIPLTRGQLQEINSKATSGSVQEKLDSDTDVIKIGLVEPKLTDEELKDLKPKYANEISLMIIATSLDVDINELKKNKELPNTSQEELKKKLVI